MNCFISKIIYVLMVFSLLSLTACGGGGGGGTTDDGTNGGGGLEPSSQAVANMILTGGADTVGSVSLDLELPEGFTLEIDNEGNLVEGVLTTDLPPDTHVEKVYQQEDSFNYGLLQIAIINPYGFSAGDFCSIHNLTAGDYLPLPEEFTVTSLSVTDLNGVELLGYDVTITVEQQGGSL